MGSLYKHLFTYRERPSRRPKEDYLTEALAHLMSRIPADEMREFVAELLLPAHHEARQTWCKESTELSGWWWSSQEQVHDRGQSGKVDLVLHEGSGEPVLVIESKIGARVGTHEIPRADGSTELRNQLEIYGKWLEGRRLDRNWPGAICLLTHNTVTPEGFGTEGRRGHTGPWEHVCHWHEVWSWLRARSRPLEATGQVPWQVFAEELAEYLREEGMSSESFTDYDIAACQLFVGSGGRLRASFKLIWTEIKVKLKEEELFPAGFSRAGDIREPFRFESDGGVIWDWAYLYPPLSREKGENWHLGWGIRFPELSSWWKTCDPPLPRSPHAFVVWAAEGKPPVPSMRPGDLPNDWLPVPDGGAIAAKALSEFKRETDNNLAIDVGRWIAEKAADILKVSKAICESNHQ